MDEDALAAIQHVIQEHFQSADFERFVDELRVINHCRKCGTRFESDVRAYPSNVFGARPYCPDCRESTPALRGLMVDKMTPRELIDRGYREDQ